MQDVTAAKVQSVGNVEDWGTRMRRGIILIMSAERHVVNCRSERGVFLSLDRESFASNIAVTSGNHFTYGDVHEEVNVLFIKWWKMVGCNEG